MMMKSLTLCAAAAGAVALLSLGRGGDGPTERLRLPSSWAGSRTQFEHVQTWQLPEALPFAPLDVALDESSGRLYVADGLNNVVQVFSDAGELVDIIDYIREMPGGWEHPMTPLAIEVDPRPPRVFIVWGAMTGAHQQLESGSLIKPIDVQWIDADGRRRVIQNAGRSDWTDFFDVALSSAVPGFPEADSFLVSGYNEEVPHSIAVKRGISTARFLVEGIGPRRPPRVAEAADGTLLLAGPHDNALLRFDRNGNPAESWSLAPMEPLAVERGMGIDLAVLVRGFEGEPGTGPVVFLNGAGTVTDALGAGDAPDAPPGGWPWSLSLGQHEAVWSTAESTFQVVRAGRSGGRVTVLYGAEHTAYFVPSPDRGTARAGIPVAVAAVPSSGAVAADRAGGRLVLFEPDGGSAVLAGHAAIDVAAVESGIAALGTDNQVHYFDTVGEEPVHVWSAECDCDYRSRIAAGPSGPVVLRPGHADLLRLDAATGSVVGEPLPLDRDAAGYADIDQAASGDLVAIDPARRAVALLGPDGTERWSWLLDEQATPVRVAAGRVQQVDVAVVLDGRGRIHFYDPLQPGTTLGVWHPALPSGSRYPVMDVDLDLAGRIYLADGSGAVHVYQGQLHDAGSATPTGAPPTGTPLPGRCAVSTDKTVSPERVLFGDTTTVTLKIMAECPDQSDYVGADIALVADLSSSMAGDRFHLVGEATRQLEGLLRDGNHRLALVTFRDQAVVEIGLHSPTDRIAHWWASAGPGGKTALGDGLRAAEGLLANASRPSALPVVVVISDGYSNSGTDPRMAAAALHEAGAIVFAIGSEDANVGLLQGIASSSDHVFVGKGPTLASQVVDSTVRMVHEGQASNLVIDDALTADVEFVAGSSIPAAARRDSRLSWTRAAIPPAGITVTYRVRPLRVGIYPTNLEAWATFDDTDGSRRRELFPVPQVEVFLPTETPSPPPTQSPEPTSTSAVAHLYLPMTLLRHCTTRSTTADVAIVLDTSGSMSGPKLEAAKAAASIFVGLLDLSPDSDQVAVVQFDMEATTVTPLTHDKGRILAGIESLAPRQGSNLRAGIQQARSELEGDRRRPSNIQVMILLTDGLASGDPQEVVDAAASARAAGIGIHAIGLGADVDSATLVAVAGDTRHYHAAPGEAELDSIYRQIAAVVVCARTE